MLGAPLYGRTFVLADPEVNTVGSPSVEAGLAGQFTGEQGFMGYNEVRINHKCYRRFLILRS